MECKDCLFLFDDYIADELEAKKFSQISKHLAICESCADFYEEFRRQQRAVERYLLKAEATPVLWKNLQTQIRNENVVPSSSRTATISGKFNSVFNNFGLLISPRRLGLSALAVIFACTIVVLLVRHKNPAAEYAQNNQQTPPISESNEPTRNQSSAADETERQMSQIDREKPKPETNAQQAAETKNQPVTRRTARLHRKRFEQKKTETIAPLDEPGKDLLPGEQKYLETIADLTEVVKSIEPDMSLALSNEYKRNLSAVDKAIKETRKSARRYPKNQDVMNFVFSAYQGKIALLSDVAKQ